MKKKIDGMQILAYLIILLLIINLIGFALKIISALLFWFVIIVFAILAYSGLIKRK